MQFQIEMDEYQLLIDVDRDGVPMVMSGNVGLEDGSERELTDDECEAVGRKHECLIEEIVIKKLKEMDFDSRMDDAARYEWRAA